MKLENYNQFHVPAAPFVMLQVSSIDSTQSIEITALIDTGADQTSIHTSIIARLNSQLGGEVCLESATGISTFPTAFVRLTVEGLTPVDLPVVAWNFSEYAILGRDFLNCFKLTMDGPNLLFSIE